MENTGTELLQDILAARVIQMVAERENITPTEAIRKVMATETYGLLLDNESYLYFESAEYILNLYETEQSGDWNRWLEM
jgi:hypothetical protein